VTSTVFRYGVEPKQRDGIVVGHRLFDELCLYPRVGVIMCHGRRVPVLSVPHVSVELVHLVNPVWHGAFGVPVRFLRVDAEREQSLDRVFTLGSVIEALPVGEPVGSGTTANSLRSITGPSKSVLRVEVRG
jgi:hypothetical protein